MAARKLAKVEEENRKKKEQEAADLLKEQAKAKKEEEQRQRVDAEKIRVERERAQEEREKEEKRQLLLQRKREAQTATFAKMELELEKNRKAEEEKNRKAEEEQSLLYIAQLEKEEEAERLKRAFFKCSICLETKEINGCYTLDCDHRICKDCLTGHIVFNISQDKVDAKEMHCPCENCFEPIQTSIVCGLTADNGEKDLFEKYLQRLKDKLIDDDVAQHRAIRCPNDKCTVTVSWEVRKEKMREGEKKVNTQ